MEIHYKTHSYTFKTISGSGLKWLLATILIQCAVVIFAKKAGLESLDGSLTKIIFNFWYLALLCSFSVQAITWIMALRSIPISIAYPWVSMVIPINLLNSWLLFDEAVLWTHIAGVFFIVSGIVLVSLERQ